MKAKSATFLKTPKKVKKKKIDPSEKKYKCGCGKLYMSYPALYTHIKTKHDGIEPEGTIKHINNKKKRRGRKRKQNYFDLKKEEYKQGAQFGQLQILNFEEKVEKPRIDIFYEFKIDDFPLLKSAAFVGKCDYKKSLRNFLPEESPL